MYCSLLGCACLLCHPCAGCYSEQFGVICAGCNKVIGGADLWVEALDKNWHPNCFVCEVRGHTYIHTVCRIWNWWPVEVGAESHGVGRMGQLHSVRMEVMPSFCCWMWHAWANHNQPWRRTLATVVSCMCSWPKPIGKIWHGHKAVHCVNTSRLDYSDVIVLHVYRWGFYRPVCQRVFSLLVCASLEDPAHPLLVASYTRLPCQPLLSSATVFAVKIRHSNFCPEKNICSSVL